jgi:hypothetical protein
MYKGFNVNFINNEICLNDYEEIGNKIFENNKNEIEQSLESFITVNKEYDADKIMNDNFPIVKADIFISHSHKDEKFAKKLAGWIKTEFNLKVFIDSCIWKYSDDLLKKIDNKHCYNLESESYSYEKRNITTSHVHIMLLMSLIKMIDETESIFFLNTSNSINIKNEIDRKTYSAWIYSEILMTKIIRPQRKQSVTKSNEFSVQDSVMPNFVYSLDMTHLKNFDTTTACLWIDAKKENMAKHSLDILYEITK